MAQQPSEYSCNLVFVSFSLFCAPRQHFPFGSVSVPMYRLPYPHSLTLPSEKLKYIFVNSVDIVRIYYISTRTRIRHNVICSQQFYFVLFLVCSFCSFCFLAVVDGIGASTWKLECRGAWSAWSVIELSYLRTQCETFSQYQMC